MNIYSKRNLCLHICHLVSLDWNWSLRALCPRPCAYGRLRRVHWKSHVFCVQPALTRHALAPFSTFWSLIWCTSTLRSWGLTYSPQHPAFPLGCLQTSFSDTSDFMPNLIATGSEFRFWKKVSNFWHNINERRNISDMRRNMHWELCSQRFGI